MDKKIKNFGFEHKSGILMPISSLPNKYGIGSFGKCAYDFADFLASTRTKCWQVLPLNPTSYGDSPYQSPASVAGNPYFVDLDILQQKGLLTKKELKDNVHNTERVDYGWLFGARYEALRMAYARFVKRGGESSPEYAKFARANKKWLEDYALFMALKVNYNYCSWNNWADEHKDVHKARKQKALFEKEMGFWKWVQFEFDSEWQALRNYCHKKGIVIIGDMPIYVAHDSMDVWQNPQEFLLDEKYNPTVVAGVPPDGFSSDGQLWGNPIYNWKSMQESGFKWWIDRVKASFKLYDILRIDHFRGFAGYYTIPAGDPTARNGWWESAPGIQLFETINSAFPKAKIIAEDLGFITDDVRELLDATGFPGMKILQFAFFDDESEYLPRCYTTSNCVVYSGSHDADCTRTWHLNLTGPARERFKKECPRNVNQPRTYDVIELALTSKANLAVVPIQDYLNLTNEQGRMNTPSVADGNWNYRLSSRYNTPAFVKRVKDLTMRTGRAK